MAATTQLWWYTARSAGIVSWALLTASVLFGLALSTKVFGKRPRPNWLLDLHRFLGGIAVVFVVIHVVAILLDQFVSFNIADVLVPFASSWKPGPVAWGIVGFYLLLAIEITSLMRARISKKLWRMTHYASFPLFVVASIHALSAGTDRNTVLLRYSVIVSAVAVLVLTLIRVDRADHHDVMTSPPVGPRRERVSSR
jgi:predicted ferric reductase